MQVQTSTKVRVNRQGEPEIWMTVSFLPRGSGNRSKVRRFAQVARNDPDMGPHTIRVIEGSSRVVMVMRPGLGLIQAIERVSQRGKDVDGQLPLFGAKLAL